jgi:hypothetical protein
VETELRRDDEREDPRDGLLELSELFDLLVASAERGTSSSSLEEESEDMVLNNDWNQQ